MRHFYWDENTKEFVEPYWEDSDYVEKYTFEPIEPCDCGGENCDSIYDEILNYFNNEEKNQMKKKLSKNSFISQKDKKEAEEYFEALKQCQWENLSRYGCPFENGEVDCEGSKEMEHPKVKPGEYIHVDKHTSYIYLGEFEDISAVRKYCFWEKPWYIGMF